MIHSGRNSDFHFELLSSHNEDEHFHQQIELLYVLHGTAKICIDGESRRIGRDDILLINLNRRHSLMLREDALACRLSIPYALLRRYFDNDHILFWCDTTLDSGEHYDTLRMLLRQMLNQLLADADEESACSDPSSRSMLTGAFPPLSAGSARHPLPGPAGSSRQPPGHKSGAESSTDHPYYTDTSSRPNHIPRRSFYLDNSA